MKNIVILVLVMLCLISCEALQVFEGTLKAKDPIENTHEGFACVYLLPEMSDIWVCLNSSALYELPLGTKIVVFYSAVRQCWTSAHYRDLTGDRIVDVFPGYQSARLRTGSRGTK